MTKKFLLLIDESGDQGLDKVRNDSSLKGSSAYFSIGAALLPIFEREKIELELRDVKETLGVKELHCTNMSHQNVAYLANKIRDFRILCFGVLSKKSTVGHYKEQISGDEQAQNYYNKCCQYLFELVGGYFERHGFSGNDVDILFEEKRGHDYTRLSRYLERISNNPIDQRARKLAHLSPFVISAKPKHEEPTLAIADTVAYSLYRAFSNDNKLKLTEQRFLHAIKRKFACSENSGKIANYGIKFVKGPVEMGLTGDEYKFANKFY